MRNTAIKRAKAPYFMKNTWKGINNILGRAPQLSRIYGLIDADTIYTSTNEVSDSLSKHFCSVGRITF